MNGTKDTGRKVFRVILADTLILTGITVFMQWVLSIMGSSLRKWFLVMLAILITAGFICGVVQLLLRIRRTALKYILIAMFTAAVLAAGSVAGPIALFAAASEEHVVDRDEGKYVAYVNGWMHTYVYYHEYKNLFICGKTVRIMEDYGKGGFDPLRKDRITNIMR